MYIIKINGSEGASVRDIIQIKGSEGASWDIIQIKGRKGASNKFRIMEVKAHQGHNSD